MKRIFGYLFVMMSGVLRSIRQNKIVDVVVCFNPIYMMDYFGGFEISPQAFFHNKPMFKNITIRSFVGVIERFNRKIAMLNRAASVPISVFRTKSAANHCLVVTFLRTISGLNLSCRDYKKNVTARLANFLYLWLPSRVLISFKTAFSRQTQLVSMFFCELYSFIKRHRQSLLLLLLMITLESIDIQYAYSASQWTKTAPAGTTNASDIDQNVATVNNEALDRLVVRYKRGLGLNYSSASTLSVLAGEIAIPDASDGTVRWRRTTATTPVGWGDLDTDSEANSTTYYVYATADTDITGMVFKISTSATAPSGFTYYRQIGSFYNDSSGNITNVVSLREDDGTDYPDTIKGWVNFNGSGTVTINDHYNVSSITDNGTGNYTVNWTTAFANANYSVSGTTRLSGFVTISSILAGSVRVVMYDYNGALTDFSTVCVMAIGDRT